MKKQLKLKPHRHQRARSCAHKMFFFFAKISAGHGAAGRARGKRRSREAARDGDQKRPPREARGHGRRTRVHENGWPNATHRRVRTYTEAPAVYARTRKRVADGHTSSRTRASRNTADPKSQGQATRSKTGGTRPRADGPRGGGGPAGAGAKGQQPRGSEPRARGSERTWEEVSS